VSVCLATFGGDPALSSYSQTNFCLNHNRRLKVLHKKTLIAFVAAVALGCVPMATNAFAAGHPGGGHVGGGRAFVGHAVAGHAMAGPARGSAGYARGGRVVVRSGGGGYYGGGGPVYYNGPVYDSCAGYGPGYGYDECPGYGVPIVGAVINGILGGPGY
jgi:hypothetical protein